VNMTRSIQLSFLGTLILLSAGISSALAAEPKGRSEQRTSAVCSFPGKSL